jgi:hypothetical protein
MAAAATNAVAQTTNSAVRIEIVGRDIEALRARSRALTKSQLGSPTGMGSMGDLSLTSGLDLSTTAGVHPLAVRISVLKESEEAHGSGEAQEESLGSVEPVLQATFWYAPEAHVVLVEGADERQMHLLERLFGEEESTMPSVVLTARELPGKALSWAQIAAGLDLIPTSAEISNNKGTAVVAAAVQTYQKERRAVAVFEKFVQLQ